MLAVDTNIIVRIVTRDDPKQAARARALVEHNEIFVATTVILETEWVLRSTYDYDIRQIVEALRYFSGLPQVRLEDPKLVSQALYWTEKGLDFADAFHLASARNCDAFVSFDASLAKVARRIGAAKIRTP